MEGAKYIKHPLDWQELKGRDGSSQRRVYAKWTVHMSDDKSGNTTWVKEWPGTLNNILDRDHVFNPPPELKYCRALVLLPKVALVSARKAMDRYDGIHIECEYLGFATIGNVTQADKTFTKNPFHWLELYNKDRSSHRKVYANWTVHILYDEKGNSTWQAVTEADVDDLLLKNGDFCLLYTSPSPRD